MNYEVFKEEFMKKFKEYLTAVYETWQIEIREVPKVNGFREGVMLHPQEGCVGSPTIYMDELYAYYTKIKDFDKACCQAAAIFVTGIAFTSKLQPKDIMELPEENIVFSLISVEGNERLLEQVPHRVTMDLAVVYRVLLDAPDGGVHSTMIHEDMAEEMDLTEEDLYELAMENTMRILPLEVKLTDDVFALVTNEKHILGAGAMMYPKVLAGLAEEMDSDLFILPSSIHEVFVIPDMGQDVEQLNQIVEEANGCIVEKSEILSNHVYYYHKEENRVCIPETYVEQACLS